jgi:hypothetical protein
MRNMNAADVLTADTRVVDRDGSIAARSTAVSSPVMGDRLFGASLGSLAFQAGHMGAGLGWHGSAAANGPAT